MAMKPWMSGIVDTCVGAELIRRSEIPHKNRLAVILLDSAFETACRAYLKHVAKIKLQKEHRYRKNLVEAVKGKLTEIDKDVWSNIDYYYEDIRCDFYHESAGKTITDVALLDYRDAVEFVIDTAFDTNVNNAVIAEVDTLVVQGLEEPSEVDHASEIRVTDYSDRTTKILIAVARLSPSSVGEVNDFFRKEGDSLRLKSEEFRNVVARNSASKKYFYHSKESKTWQLSSLGRFKLSQLTKEQSNG